MTEHIQVRHLTPSSGLLSNCLRSKCLFLQQDLHFTDTQRTEVGIAVFVVYFGACSQYLQHFWLLKRFQPYRGSLALAAKVQTLYWLRLAPGLQAEQLTFAAWPQLCM